MKFSLLALSARLPDLNNKVYTETDFYNICTEENIFTAEACLPKRTNGIYLIYDNSPMIIIQSSLNYYEKLEAGFHELGHHFLHTPSQKSAYFKTTNFHFNQQELEAQAFALIALIPLTLLRQIELYPDIQNDIPDKLLKDRLDLFFKYNS